MLIRPAVIAALMMIAACGSGKKRADDELAAAAPKGVVIISIVGTNDLHGALDRLPIFAGFVNNLRDERLADHGGVVLIDGGDIFQGTIESNMNEGAAAIAAYNAIGYAAAAVGNHEFDFGPAGPAPTPQRPGDDPRGALRERIAQAEFPLLSANVVVADTGEPFTVATTTVIASDARIAIIGISTESTPYTTMPANFVGLAMRPLAAAVEREARAARSSGHQIVAVAAHAGSQCKDTADPVDASSCARDGEIFEVARALPAGLVDVIVAGHTHAAVAHYVNGIAVIESYASGRAFGRVDVRVDLDTGKVASTEIHPPRDLCPGDKRVATADCQPGDYAGKPVVADLRIAKVIAEPLERASAARGALLGVEVTHPVTRSYGNESALGNLFADLMLAARPEADIAITNGGGLRADLPKGPLTYGSLYEAAPFDNRFSLVRLTGKHLRAVIVGNLNTSSGIFSFAGVRVAARCQQGDIYVSLTRTDGRVIGDDDALVVVTSDFLASGGDGAFGRLDLPDGAITSGGGDPIRDGMADVLRERGGTLSGKDPAVFSADHRRVVYPGKRPMACAQK